MGIKISIPTRLDLDDQRVQKIISKCLSDSIDVLSDSSPYMNSILSSQIISQIREMKISEIVSSDEF